MKEYDITAFVGFTIHAETKEEAINIAYNKLSILSSKDFNWEVVEEKAGRV